MAEAVKTKRRTRGGHRAYVSQVLPEAKGFIEEGESTTEMRPRNAHFKASLEEQLESLRTLDAQILSGLVEQEGVTDEEIAEEAQIAGKLKGEIKAITTTLAELLTPKSESPVSSHPNPSVASGNVATNNTVRAKLPKLEVRCFNGRKTNGKNSGTVTRAPFIRTQTFRISTSFPICVVFSEELREQPGTGAYISQL